MNGLIIEVADFQCAGHTSIQPTTEEKAVQSRLLHMMKQAYDELFEEYFEPNLQKDGTNEPIYPEFTITIDEEVYEIVFDYDLYESLCDIYIIEGWNGVSLVEQRIAQIIANESLPGDIKDKRWAADVNPKEEGTWNLAKPFFNYTHKMLALLIRETLVTIEQLAADQILGKLSSTNIAIQKAFDQYKIQSDTTKRKSDSLLKGHGGNVEEITTYSLENEALSKDLFDLLTAAVNAREQFDETTKRLGVLQSRIENAESVLTTDSVPNYNYEADVEERTSLANLKQAAEQYLDKLHVLIVKQHPLGLLIYGLLEKGFKQPKMEDQFGATVDKLRKSLESFGAQIDPRISQTENLLPFSQTDDIYRDVLRFNVPPEGVEKFVVEHSWPNIQKSEFLPLVSEGNLNRLIDEEIIATDSFEYIVATHYLLGLIKRLGELAQQDKQIEDLWKALGKISSALSLAALITPVTAEATPFLRGAASIADLALLAYTISSVTGRLRQFDETMRHTLVNEDGSSNDVLAQLGEILSLRKQFCDSLTEQAAIELVNMLVLGNIPIVKEYLLLRIYYYDLQNLFEEDEDEAED